jgi:hypothetical protein
MSEAPPAALYDTADPLDDLEQANQHCPEVSTEIRISSRRP